MLSIQIKTITLALVLAVTSCKSVKKQGATDSSTGADEPEGVSVVGDLPTGKTVDFVESEDSVQISGVNLTSDAHELRVDVLSDMNGKAVLTEFKRETFVGNSFAVAGLPYGKYVLIYIDGKASSILHPVNKPDNGATNVGVFARVDDNMAVASQLFKLAVDGYSGQESGKSLFGEQLFSIPSLVVLAGSITDSIRLKSPGTNASVPVNLKLASQEFMSQSFIEATKVAAEQRVAVAKAISSAAVSTIHSRAKKTANTLLLAQVTALQVKRDTIYDSNALSEGFDPGDRVMRSIGQRYPEVFVIYAASQSVSTKYSVEIATTGKVSEIVASEYEESYYQERSRYTSSPADYQSQVQTYVPPTLPAEFPKTDYNSGSYTSGPSSNPNPQPTTTPSSAPTGTPTTTPTSSPTPSPTPGSTQSPAPEQSGPPSPP